MQDIYTLCELAGPLTIDERVELENMLSRECVSSLPALFTLAAIRGELRESRLECTCILRNKHDQILTVIALIYAPYGNFIEINTRSLGKRCLDILNTIVKIVRNLTLNYEVNTIFVDNARIVDMLVQELPLDRYCVLIPLVLDLEDRSNEEMDLGKEMINHDSYRIDILDESYHQQVQSLMSMWSQFHVKVSLYTLKHGISLGAFHREKLVGYLSTYVTLPECWLLASLFVHPDHRRRGIGSKLLRSMIKLANGKTKRLVAAVDLLNIDARRFYLRHRFKPIYRAQHSLTLRPPS